MDQLIDRVMGLTGLRDKLQAERLLRVTMDALAACLSLPDRQRWAQSLPETLRDSFLSTPYDPRQRPADVYAAVARAEATGARFGVEHAQGAIRTLAGCLSTEDAALLARHLSSELAELLHDPTRASGALSARPGQPPTARPEGHIASGAGGSAHPVSEARPGAPQPGSVGDWSKHRTAHSLGDGVEPSPDETLASGKPGSKRGLGDADDSER